MQITTRNKLMDQVFDSGQGEVHQDVLDKHLVETLLNDLEKRVNEIAKILGPIQGISEIDDVKSLIQDLSNDLY